MMAGTDTVAASFSFTYGASHTQSAWGDARNVSWTKLVEMLTAHVPGAKEGPCIVPAVFTGSSRKKEEAAQIDVAFLDSDSGATLDQIVDAIKAHGWEAVVSSTHSHMTTRTEASLKNWDRFFAKHPSASARDFLVSEKGYLETVADSATLAKTDDERVYIDHAPCPKFRVAVPLLKPWRAADYPSQAAANAAWKGRIEALASALSLPHDQACTDTSRLFYLPRRPPNGAVPETAVVSGAYCDIFALEVAPTEDLFSATGKANGKRPQSGMRCDYADPITGEFIDLTTWARNYGRTFLIAKALHAKRPGAITGLIVDNTKVHIRCPNEDAHTNQGQDNATFVVNAGNAATEGFVIHCRHAHCTGQDRLFFVNKMLTERWLEIDDLTAADFHLKVEPAGEEPPDIDDPGYWQSIEIDAEPMDSAQNGDDSSGALPHVYDPWNTLRPVRFPIEAIPAELRSFVLNRGRIIGADPCAIAWSAISACSAAIDGRIHLQMKRHDPWSVPPAIWIALIGPPSSKKTPIVNTVWSHLQKIQARALKQHQIEMAEWKALPKEEKSHTPEPKMPRRLVSHDATMEALQDILSKQDRGIGVLRDELAGWIGSMEKYAPGKGGAADRAFALQSYNGGNHVVDRVMRGTLAIENLLCVMCGGIQPERLRQFGDLTDDGLWQRFVPVIVAPAGMGEDEANGDDRFYSEMIERLLRIPHSTRVTLSEEAHGIREDIQRRIFALEQSEVLGSRFVGFCGKMTGLWGRLTLVLHLMSEPGSTVVREATANAARTLLFQSVLPNAARVYTAMGGAGGDIEATQSIAGYILTKGLSRLVMSDLTRNVRVCRGRSTEDVRKLLSPLEAGGWLKPEKDYAPTSWLVADQVHHQFASQAEKEANRRAAVRALITGYQEENDA